MSPFKLVDYRANDNSRIFAEMPVTCTSFLLRLHIRKLRGAKFKDYLTDNLTTSWTDFSYCEYEFSINVQFDEYWFFVNDPNCSDEILQKVADHFAQIIYQKSGFRKWMFLLGFKK